MTSVASVNIDSILPRFLHDSNLQPCRHGERSRNTFFEEKQHLGNTSRGYFNVTSHCGTKRQPGPYLHHFNTNLCKPPAPSCGPSALICPPDRTFKPLTAHPSCTSSKGCCREVECSPPLPSLCFEEHHYRRSLCCNQQLKTSDCDYKPQDFPVSQSMLCVQH